MSSPDVSKIVWIWLSDGSEAPFRVLPQLPVTHVRLLGRAIPYKRPIDTMVSVGTSIVEAAPDDAPLPEAEWCLKFPTDGPVYVVNRQEYAPMIEHWARLTRPV